MKISLIQKLTEELKKYEIFCESLFSVRYTSEKPEDTWYDEKLANYYAVKNRIKLLIELIEEK